MGVHAGFQAFAHVLLEGVACHRDDGDACGIGAVEGAYGPGSGQAVHLRHRHVHEDGVEGSGGVCGKRLHRLRAIADDRHVRAFVLHDRCGDFSVQVVVLDQQQAATLQGRSARCLLGFARGRSRVERDGDHERGPFVQLAGDLDGTAHQLDELLDDGHAQARTADGARHTRLARKRLEHALQELRAHTDAGIGDLPTEQNLAIGQLA